MSHRDEALVVLRGDGPGRDAEDEVVLDDQAS